MNKDFCEREREREFFKSPALSYIYIYTTRPKRKKKNSERTRDYSCPDLSTVHYLSSRRLAGWDLCSETQTLFHLPAGRHLILCDVGITPIVFFLSFFQTHTQKRCIMKMISFSPFQTDRCGITQLLSCWTKRKSRPAQVVSRRWPKKKKKTQRGQDSFCHWPQKTMSVSLLFNFFFFFFRNNSIMARSLTYSLSMGRWIMNAPRRHFFRPT